MLDQLRAAIVAVLNGANIGTFYPKERFSKNMNTLKEMYGQGEGIAGGYIRLKRASAKTRTLPEPLKPIRLMWCFYKALLMKTAAKWPLKMPLTH